MRNDQVIKAWNNGRKAKSNSMKTDGNLIYSYGLVIGRTDCDGNKIIFDWTATSDAFVSQTTSVHVNKAKQLTNASIMRPEAAKIAGILV